MSCATSEWVIVSRIQMSHVTHMNVSCHTSRMSCATSEWVITSSIWISHVTHIDESCHTSWMSVAWLIANEWHDSFIYVTWLIDNVWHDSCHTSWMSVAWLIANEWHDSFIHVTWLEKRLWYGMSPHTEEIGHQIITTAKISNKCSQESPYISNTFLRSPQNFKQVFTWVNRVPVTQKIGRENRLIWRSEYFRSDLLCEWNATNHE